MIDDIVKRVQGDYITHFQEKINYLFPLVWQKARSKDEKVKLLKIFKIWGMFFTDKEKLKTISETLQLDQLVSVFGLLTIVGKRVVQE